MKKIVVVDEKKVSIFHTYVILPFQIRLNEIRKHLYAEYAASVFITTDKSKANNVLRYLNQLPRENLTRYSLLGFCLSFDNDTAINIPIDKNEPLFQIKIISEVQKSDLIPHNTITYKYSGWFGTSEKIENTEVYPYNYIFMESIPNAEPSRK